MRNIENIEKEIQQIEKELEKNWNFLQSMVNNRYDVETVINASNTYERISTKYTELIREKRFKEKCKEEAYLNEVV